MKIVKNRNYLFLFSISTAIFLLTTSFSNLNQDDIPIWFGDYGIEIRSIDKLGDTISYNKNSKENFKLVFYDEMGKCHFEHYVNGKLSEKGNFENSLDTLKRYVSKRLRHGANSPIEVQKYFEPLKNGEWISYKSGKVYRRLNYVKGILEVAL